MDDDPGYTRARLTLASCYHEAGRADDARPHVEWLIENDPEHADGAKSLLEELG